MPPEDDESPTALESLDRLPAMGWYLDPSLFLPFIQTNVRRSLDAAVPHDGKIVLSVRGLPGRKRQTFVPVVIGGQRVAFELTSTLEQLQNIHLSHRTVFYYSELTKAEVFRSVRRAYGEREPDEITAWWDAFRFLLTDYRETPVGLGEGGALSDLALRFPIQKNAQDYLHVLTAMQGNLAFITCDKLGGQLSELRSQFYAHIYYWPEIRDRIPILDVLRDPPNALAP